MFSAGKSSFEKPSSPRRVGLIAFAYLLLVGTFLALSLVLGKLAGASGAPPLMFLMCAMVGAGAILLVVSVLSNASMGLSPRLLEYALVSGALFALPNGLGFLAVSHVGAGFISISFAFPILLTWVLAVLLRLELLSWLRLLGVLLGLAGGLVLASAKGGSGDDAQGWALLVLAMPLVIACGNIYRTLRWPSGAAPTYLAALMMLGGALTLLPAVLLFESDQAGLLFQSSYLLQLLGIEILVFAILYIFYFLLQACAGPVYLSQIGMVAAFVGTLIAVLLLDELPPGHLGLVGVLIVGGTLLFHRGGRAAEMATNR